MSAPRSRALETLLERLSTTFGGDLRTDEAALDAASGDESGLPPTRPGAVFLAQSAPQVASLAKEAADLGVGLVPRGGGTGKAGACIPRADQVVVDLSGMNQVLAVRPGDLLAVVQPGVITRDLDELAGREGFMYPPDPASWESSTLGGNIATNAGGPRAVKYGVTHRYVWGLEIVLAGGDVIRTGRQSIKGVAGLDLTSLLVGSEGTLGFITEATLHIVPAPPEVETGWLTFESPQAASVAADAVFAAGILPRMLELLDATALDAVRPHSGFRIAEGVGAALLVETDGRDGAAMQDLVRLCEVAMSRGATDSAIAQSEKEREGMRRARRLVSSALKEQFPRKLSDDIAVPRSRMPELLERAQAAAEAAGIRSSAYGHLGDGNLHLNLLCKDDQIEIAAQVRQQMLREALAMGGTVSGEHGIGLTKRAQLPMEHSKTSLDLQRRVKASFDPKGIMNPGKVF